MKALEHTRIRKLSPVRLSPLKSEKVAPQPEPGGSEPLDDVEDACDWVDSGCHCVAK